MGILEEFKFKYFAADRDTHNLLIERLACLMVKDGYSFGVIENIRFRKYGAPIDEVLFRTLLKDKIEMIYEGTKVTREVTKVLPSYKLDLLFNILYYDQRELATAMEKEIANIAIETMLGGKI